MKLSQVFTAAIAVALADAMKDFAPVGIYCDPNVFTQSTRSGEVFALCEQD